MTELFTVDGIKPQFLTPIRNNLHRVLQKITPKLIIEMGLIM